MFAGGGVVGMDHRMMDVGGLGSSSNATGNVGDLLQLIE